MESTTPQAAERKPAQEIRDQQELLRAEILIHKRRPRQEVKVAITTKEWRWTNWKLKRLAAQYRRVLFQLLGKRQTKGILVAEGLPIPSPTLALSPPLSPRREAQGIQKLAPTTQLPRLKTEPSPITLQLVRPNRAHQAAKLKMPLPSDVCDSH